jgi:hypothetical protein
MVRVNYGHGDGEEIHRWGSLGELRVQVLAVAMVGYSVCI